MTYSDFLRLFHTRGKNLMWLVGAGACASSGIPTATHMIWNFKRQIYCSNLHVPIQAVSDLGNPVIQEMIQTHLNSVTGHPRADEFREYAHYFEFTHPSAQDRRRYIEAMIADKRPSYGHLALVTLMAIQKCEIVWTTNFDKLVENAAAKIFNTVDKLIVATPDNANIAVDAIQTGRRPLLGKLHGDFFSEHLKNTSSELKAQDQELRASLLQATAA
jgi:NAD-dependent SIR2 family protein deacetylase